MKQLYLDFDKEKKMNITDDNEALLGAVFDALLYDEDFSLKRANEFTTKIAARLNMRINCQDDKRDLAGDAVCDLSNTMTDKVLRAYQSLEELSKYNAEKVHHRIADDPRINPNINFGKDGK